MKKSTENIGLVVCYCLIAYAVVHWLTGEYKQREADSASLQQEQAAKFETLLTEKVLPDLENLKQYGSQSGIENTLSDCRKRLQTAKGYGGHIQIKSITRDAIVALIDNAAFLYPGQNADRLGEIHGRSKEYYEEFCKIEASK